MYTLHRTFKKAPDGSLPNNCLVPDCLLAPDNLARLLPTDVRTLLLQESGLLRAPQHPIKTHFILECATIYDNVLLICTRMYSNETLMHNSSVAGL